MIAAAITFAERRRRPGPALDAEALRKAADDAVDEVELDEPRDATVKISGGKPVVVPAVDGTTVSAKALAAAVEPALTEVRRRARPPRSSSAGAKATSPPRTPRSWASRR